MRRSRVLVLVLLLAGVVAASAVLAARLWPEGEYGHDLRRYGDADGVATRFGDLGSGHVLAIGSPDSHRILVQWRDPDGSGWTAPQLVWNERAVAIDNTLRTGDGVAVIQQAFTTDTSDDTEASAHWVAIVCRASALSCSASRPAGSARPAQVAPDGGHALLSSGERGVWVWEPGAGIHRVPWQGGRDAAALAGPALAPDGGLRLVTSSPARGACTFRLWSAEPGTAAFRPVALQRGRLRGAARSECRTYLDSDPGLWSPDWIAVHPSDHRAPDFWFERTAAGWRATAVDPSGLDAVDVPRGCCDTVVGAFIHGADVAVGSPDGRSLRLQVHRRGEDRWGPPVTVGTAPRRVACDLPDVSEVGDGAAVVLGCREAGDARGVLVAVSADLESWRARYVPDVTNEVLTDDEGRLVVDDLRWSPEDGWSDGA